MNKKSIQRGPHVPQVDNCVNKHSITNDADNRDNRKDDREDDGSASDPLLSNGGISEVKLLPREHFD